MPSRLMTISEALQYAKKYKLEGIKVTGNILEYVNSSGNLTRVKIDKNTLVYYRGRGRWAIYSPERDAKIPSHRKPQDYKVRVPRAWAQYGDMNPVKEVRTIKKKKKVGRGKGKRKVVTEKRVDLMKLKKGGKDGKYL